MPQEMKDAIRAKTVQVGVRTWKPGKHEGLKALNQLRAAGYTRKNGYQIVAERGYAEIRK